MASVAPAITAKLFAPVASGKNKLTLLEVSFQEAQSNNGMQRTRY
jgi:hypothetical protein